MTIQVRQADGMMRQFCRWCENEYGHEFDPHGPWSHPRDLATVEELEREHDLKHHSLAHVLHTHGEDHVS